MNKKSKRHCMIVHAYYPARETRVQREAEALLEAGIEVDVICLQEKGGMKYEEVNDIRIFRMPVRRHKGKGTFVQLIEYLSFFFLAFFRVTSLHLKNKYAVVQVHNLPDFLVFAALIPRISGAAVILDLHDLMPEFYASRFKCSMESARVKIVSLQEKISCHFAHHVITVTETWRQHLISRGLKPSKCSVVMNTADDRHFKPGMADANKPGGGGFRLIYHGVVTRHNGTDLILNALSSLVRQTPDISLTIHGSGDYLGETQRLAGELGLDEYVYFSVKFVPVEELPAIIAPFDLGIVPIRSDVFTDGILPTKLMEYAALGIPAVASRTSAISTYFDDTMVEFFEPGDAEGLARSIERIYRDRSKCRDLSQNIRKFNRTYNWSAQKSDYIQLVNSLTRR